MESLATGSSQSPSSRGGNATNNNDKKTNHRSSIIDGRTSSSIIDEYNAFAKQEEYNRRASVQSTASFQSRAPGSNRHSASFSSFEHRSSWHQSSSTATAAANQDILSMLPPGLVPPNADIPALLAALLQEKNNGGGNQFRGTIIPERKLSTSPTDMHNHPFGQHSHHYQQQPPPPNSRNTSPTKRPRPLSAISLGSHSNYGFGGGNADFSSFDPPPRTRDHSVGSIMDKVVGGGMNKTPAVVKIEDLEGKSYHFKGIGYANHHPSPDFSSWLRSLRLHKYAECFANMNWKDIIALDDEQLQAKGVSALGARRKMLKVFEMVKSETKPAS